MSRVRLSACLLVVALVLVPRLAVGQDKEDPIVAQVKPRLKDPGQPFTMVVLLKVKEDGVKQFESAFAPAVRATRQEKGNLAYDLNRDTRMPTRYLLYERWKNLPALEEHLKAPHVRTLLSEIGPLLEGAPEVRVLLPAAEKK